MTTERMTLSGGRSCGVDGDGLLLMDELAYIHVHNLTLEDLRLIHGAIGRVLAEAQS